MVVTRVLVRMVVAGVRVNSVVVTTGVRVSRVTMAGVVGVVVTGVRVSRVVVVRRLLTGVFVRRLRTFEVSLLRVSHCLLRVSAACTAAPRPRA